MNKEDVSYGYNWMEINNLDGTFTRTIYSTPIYLDKIVNITNDSSDILVNWKGNKLKIKLNITENIDQINGISKLNNNVNNFINITKYPIKIESVCVEEKNITYDERDEDNKLTGEMIDEISCIQYENKSVGEYEYEFSWHLETIDKSNFNISYISIELKNLTPMNIISDGNTFYLPDGLILNLDDLLNGNYNLLKEKDNKIKITAEKKDNFTASEIDLDPILTTNTTKDTYIRSTSSAYYSYNYGSSVTATFDDGSGYRALIDFDISSILSNSTVTDADIYLYFGSASSTDTKYAYPIKKSWNEGTGDAELNDATINGTTWNARWYSTSISANWTSQGLGAGTDYNNTSGYFSSFTGGTGWQSFDVTKIINLTTNQQFNLFGWVLINQDTSDHTFNTKESVTVNRRPYITITYSLPSPKLSFIEPLNNTYQNSKTINLTCNGTVEGINNKINFTDVTFVICNDSIYTSDPTCDPLNDFYDWGILEIPLYNGTLGNKTWELNWSITLGSDDIYKWSCWASIVREDGSEEMSWTPNEGGGVRTFTIDSISPNLTFVNPTPSNNSRQIGNSVEINTTFIDLSQLSSCWLQWNDTTSITNYTMQNTSNSCNYTLSTTDGIFYWFKVFANDSLNNMGNTSTRTFRENTAPTRPLITLTPNYPFANDTLNCTASGSTDSEEDSLTYYYQFNDGDYSTNNLFNCSNQSLESGNSSYEGFNEGEVGACLDPQNLSDGKWDTPLFFDYSKKNCTIYLNYTYLPSSLSYIYFNQTNIAGSINDTITSPIPNSCTSGSNISIKYFFIGTFSTYWNINKTIFCYNFTSNSWTPSGLYSNVTLAKNNEERNRVYETKVIYDALGCTKKTNTTCNAKAYDSYEYSPINSSNVTILNYPPSITSWNVSNATWSNTTGKDLNIYENQTNGTYTFNVTNVVDIDYGETHWYDWFIDGVRKTIDYARSWFDWVLGGDDIGSHNVTVYVNDTSNNITSQYWNITIIEGYLPSVTITYPINNYNYNYNLSMRLNNSVRDTHLLACWYSLNGGINTTLSCNQNTTFNISEGSQVLEFWANDTSNNINKTKITFTTDLTYPLIDIEYPINDTNFDRNTNIQINYTISDTNLQSCWWTNNTGITNNTLTCGQNITISFSDANNIVVKIWANDSSGNTNISYVAFNVDGVNPVVIVKYPPSNDLWYTNNTFTINYTYIEVNPSDCWYTKDKGITNTTLTNCGNNITGQTWTEGTNNITVYMNDTAGKEGLASRNFTIDSIRPDINIVYPSNDSWFNRTNNIQINYTVSDVNLQSCWWTNNTGLTNNTITCGTNITSSFIDGINKVVKIWANDSANNINSTQVTFNVDANPPLLDIVYPSNNTWFNRTNDIQINYTISDTNLQSCWWTNNTGITNNTLTCGQNITSSFSDANNIVVKIWANDSSGNTNISYVAFNVDSTFPLIDYGSLTETNGINISRNFIQVNVTITENNFQNITYLLWNSTAKFNSTNYFYTTETRQINWTNLPNGVYTYNITLIDKSNNRNTTQTRTIILDITNPNANLTYPPNNTYNATLNQNFTINATDNSGISNVSLNIYNSTGLWNSTIVQVASDVLETGIGIVVALVDEIYTWFVQVRDWANNIFTSSNQTLTIDTINPSIYFDSSSYTNATWSISGAIYINITTNDTNKDYVGLEFNGVNETFTHTNGNYSAENKTGLSTGTYNFYAWVNDSANNYNTTDIRTLWVDVENPSITIKDPTSKNYNTNVDLLLNYTISDVNLQSCWWHLDGTANTTLTNCQNSTFNVTEASHTIVVYANDSSGRISLDEVNFTVNLSPPSISLDYPSDNQWLNYLNNVDFNYTATDTDDISECQFWIDSTGTWHKNNTNNGIISGQQNFTRINLTEGNFIWNVWCNDTGDNGVWGNPIQNLTVKIDSSNPLIKYDTGTKINNFNTTLNWIYVDIDLTETNLENLTYLLRNETAIYNITNYTTPILNINWTNLPNANYSYNVSVIDKAGNFNSTETRKILLDDTPPDITINEPQSVSYPYNENINLNTSITDNLIGIHTCWYSVKNFTGGFFDKYVVSNTTFTCNQNTTFNVSSGDIDYAVTIYANDSLGNEDSYEVLFGVRTISPAISLGVPDNFHFSNKTDLILNATATDASESISSCELWGNWTGWHKNQTKTGIVNGVLFSFNPINLSLEGTYIWNIRCNDTLNNYGWGVSNRTFGVDITFPSVNITSLTPTAGSQTFTFNTLVTDTYLSSCKYSIFNSSSGIDGLNNNVSMTCNALTSATTSSYGNFNLTVYAIDIAKNENSSTKSFTTSTSAPSGGGGGGVSEKVSVVALIKPKNDTKLWSNLDRAKFYSGISKTCLNISAGYCSLSEIQLLDLKIELKDFYALEIDLISLERWIDQYNNKEFENVLIDKSDVIKYGLFVAELVFLPTEFSVSPKQFDRFFILWNPQMVLEANAYANKVLKSASIIEGDPGFNVSFSENVVKISYTTQGDGFLTKTVNAKANYISIDGETALQSINWRLINIRAKVIGIPLWSFLIVLIGIVMLGFIYKRNIKLLGKKVWKNDR